MRIKFLLIIGMVILLGSLVSGDTGCCFDIETGICSGNAELPSGLIKEGDVIKKCSGNVALRYIPSNTIFGAYDFE